MGSTNFIWNILHYFAWNVEPGIPLFMFHQMMVTIGYIYLLVQILLAKTNEPLIGMPCNL